MQFLNPWGALGFLLVPVLILLYMLKQRYKEEHIPSIFLWKQVATQWEASTPWQKWRKNILFFLQLSAIIFLTLALMKPVWRGEGIGQNSIVILDVSMSMQARENNQHRETGETRFESAKTKIENLIKQLHRAEEMTLIISGAQNELLILKSKEQAELLQILNSVKVQNGTNDIEEAIQLARSVASKETAEMIYVFTDRAIASTGENVIVQNEAVGSENIAISNLSYSFNNADETLSVLGLLYNYGQTKTVAAELWADGQLLDIKDITLESDSAGNIIFDGIDNTIKTLSLVIEEDDALKADNTAYCVVQENRNYKILLQTQRNIFLEKAITLREDIELYKSNPNEEIPKGEFDLVILDGWGEIELPQIPNLWVINAQLNNDWFDIEETKIGEIETANSTLPKTLLNHVSMDKLRFAKGNVLTAADSESETLIYNNDAPLIIAKDENGEKRIAFGFSFHESNLPMQKDFPILVQNILGWFLPTREGHINQIRVGEQTLITMSEDSYYYDVRLPDGTTLSRQDKRVFVETFQMGIYTVNQYDSNGNVLEENEKLFAVNAPNKTESELRTASSQSGTNTAGNSNLFRIYDLLPYFIAIAFIIILLEWWVYHYGH